MSEPVETTQQPVEEPAGDTPAGGPVPEEPQVPTEGEVPAEPEAPAVDAEPDEEVRADLDELVARTRERDEYLKLAQRTQADFDNYRKRMAREAAQAGDRGMAKLAKELLPALDHLELAVKAAEGHEDVVKGFAIVRDEFFNALAKAGIEAYSPQGQVFDPSEHEAMASQPAEDAEPGTVVAVYQQGYRLKGSVLRPARVVVAA
jgi:molecular chaperone GrpE